MDRKPRLGGVESVARTICVLRGHRVILDSDLAALYGVRTARLNEAVKRNAERFPEDFVFQLTAIELAALMSQSATSKIGRGGRRKLPWAFTEHGAIQAANVLSSQRAITMGVYVVRAFVGLREALIFNRELAQNLHQLEKRLGKHLAVHDEAIAAILAAIRNLMHPGVVASASRPISGRNRSQRCWDVYFSTLSFDRSPFGLESSLDSFFAACGCDSVL